MDDGERQERRVGGKDVNRNKAVERCYWLILKMKKGVTNPKMMDILLKQKESKGVEMDLFLPVF